MIIYYGSKSSVSQAPFSPWSVSFVQISWIENKVQSYSGAFWSLGSGLRTILAKFWPLNSFTYGPILPGPYIIRWVECMEDGRAHLPLTLKQSVPKGALEQLDATTDGGKVAGEQEEEGGEWNRAGESRSELGKAWVWRKLRNPNPHSGPDSAMNPCRPYTFKLRILYS